MFRRYSSLEKQITERNLDDDDANAELDAMESELTVREMELKDILNFYQQVSFTFALQNIHIFSGKIHENNILRSRNSFYY